MADVRAETSQEELLDELLVRWQEARGQGQASLEGLCAGRPELVSPLRQRAQAFEAMEAALGLRSPASEGWAQQGTVTLVGPGTVNGKEAPPAIPGYELLGEIASGGMGVVYRARQLRLNRVEAIKMLLAGAHAGADRLARFRTEVEAVARLRHPNVVQVYQVGDLAGQPYFAMEHLEGGSLSAKLARGLLPARESARLVRTLAEAVQHAHERGIVHRDLKPANVLLAEDGTPKIADFGLAKVLHTADEPGGPTCPGAIMGTPCYLAPEQAEGRTSEVGPPADVYALGAILYECLTGRPPFKGETTLDTLEQVRVREPLPPRALQPKVERDLENICLQCLRKESARRYGSARALADDLGRYLEGRAVLARPVPLWERSAKWVRRQPALAALLLVSVLAGASLLGLWARFTARLTEERNFALEEGEKARQQEQEALKQKALADQGWSIASAQRDEANEQRQRAEQILEQTTLIVKGMVKKTREVKVQGTGQPGDLLYSLARYYAGASKSARENNALRPKDRARLAGDLADRAVDLLECARTDGYFLDPQHRKELARDRDGVLAPLRGRSAFEALIKNAGK